MAAPDRFKIDSHKLIYHVPSLYAWLRGKDIYPIYMEMGLYGGCNHRCIFCAFDFLEYKPLSLDADVVKRFICMAGKKGTKSILYSGEGEPLLHKDIADIIAFTKKCGIDAALVTNGVMLDEEKAEKTLRHLTWMKVSLDAGTKDTYALIHGTKKEDFDKVIGNLENAVRIKRKNKYGCSIGAQYLLLPQNYKEVKAAAKVLRDTGIDYMVIKPYSQHPFSKNRIAPRFNLKRLACLEKELEEYSNSRFQIIFRRHTMERLTAGRPYKYCIGAPFTALITTEGDVYSCNIFLGKNKFSFGNIYENNLTEIWKGKRRKAVMDFIYKRWKISKCRKACRIDAINTYLWELRHPDSHVNFI